MAAKLTARLSNNPIAEPANAPTGVSIRREKGVQ
jgi:hypothetical protein